MKIACIGGGPAGLYLGILVKRSAPAHEVVIFERNRPDDTFGFGVVFSDATLGHLAAADPETHAQIAARFARWDDIEIQVGGERLRSTGHGFCGLERKALLQILQARAAALGVRVVYEREIRTLDELRAEGADVIVACDGVASWVRGALAEQLRPEVDVRPNKFVWLGCTVPYPAFTFLFKPTPHGLFRVHAYRYHAEGSTFIVECRDDTWRRAGLDTADEDRTVAILAQVFADELAGHRLIKNRSIWRSFPTVRCERWHANNVVLMGDAAHTAHFSIGSGTKLAMEDAIALRDELLGGRDVPAALAAYEARRRPEVEALQAAAQASLEWFEGTERYLKMAPVQFTYSLMTRSLRVSHASVARRDPHLARGVERLLAAAVGITSDPPTPSAANGTIGDADGEATREIDVHTGNAVPPPCALPFALGDRWVRSRIAVAPFEGASRPDAPESADSIDDATRGRRNRPPSAAPRRSSGEGAAELDHRLVALGDAAVAGAGLVVTDVLAVADPAALGLGGDDDAVAWRRIVDHVHAQGALIAARVALPCSASAHSESRLQPVGDGDRIGAAASSAAGSNDACDAVTRAVQRAASSGFDLVVLDPGGDPGAIEQLPAMIAAARGAWRADGWIAAVVADLPTARAAVVGHAAQLVRAGAALLWVTAGPTRTTAAGHGARLPAAPLADQLRNELGVATAIDARNAVMPDLDAAIAAGRADLVVVTRMPDTRRDAA